MPVRSVQGTASNYLSMIKLEKHAMPHEVRTKPVERGINKRKHLSLNEKWSPFTFSISMKNCPCPQHDINISIIHVHRWVLK